MFEDEEEDRMMSDLFDKLARMEGGQILKKDIEDLIAAVSLNSYSQGIKTGVNMAKLFNSMD